MLGRDASRKGQGHGSGSPGKTITSNQGEDEDECTKVNRPRHGWELLEFWAPIAAVIAALLQGLAYAGYDYFYMHWTEIDGRVLRGRNHVLAMLEWVDLPAPPSAVELRDGQIYRWQSDPSA
jgi:hypothetical protein